MSYVSIAYGVALAVIGGYIWSVARRLHAVERELEGLDEASPGGGDTGPSPDDGAQGGGGPA